MMEMNMWIKDFDDFDLYDSCEEFYYDDADLTLSEEDQAELDRLFG